MVLKRFARVTYNFIIYSLKKNIINCEIRPPPFLPQISFLINSTLLYFQKVLRIKWKKWSGVGWGILVLRKKTKYWSSNGCLYTFNDIIDFSPNSTNKIKHIKDKTYSQKCGGGGSFKKIQTPRKIYEIFFSNII